MATCQIACTVRMRWWLMPTIWACVYLHRVGMTVPTRFVYWLVSAGLVATVDKEA